MLITCSELASMLGVSETFIRDRIDAGDAAISAHVKLRRKKSLGTGKRASVDRSPVRIHARDVAQYLLANSREHAWTAFAGDDSTLDADQIDVLERRIWSWLLWYRNARDISITENG